MVKDRDAFGRKVYEELQSVIYLKGKSENHGYPSGDQMYYVSGAFTDVIFRRANAE
ncbi:hypothetical protein [Clostridium botulinum]|uniref:hypothetical protein n=1 Tax=Clostridium botulinum TaxID=1491 RepID=UPI00020759CD|nr:hypothetical protein [Clostridium botulinum]AEB77539.1 hypothetical protein CbC4_6014 [Clostridium botulinum BKT015925]KEH95937.1 hypothetical protein Y848_p0113 [Clostridium botulinum C/D str. Sp77]MCD3198322.1 hypothetical protein [Clostridium botulinum C/D]MCD3204394.1 hypothetical protein [Clostridium botulinum C/D]MCD3212562.1 hypothetical protein [Clostridium botulinum C/D]